MEDSSKSIIKVTLAAAFAIVVFVLLGLGSCSAYNGIRVWNAETSGKAVLAEAESSRQVAVREAKAKLESAKFLADAEVARAEGVAKANDIIMKRLGGPEGYLRYLQIQAYTDQKAALIYVPTENGLPITEASRLQRSAPAASE
jgi:hypothetical protein